MATLLQTFLFKISSFIFSKAGFYFLTILAIVSLLTIANIQTKRLDAAKNEIKSLKTSHQKQLDAITLKTRELNAQYILTEKIYEERIKNVNKESLQKQRENQAIINKLRVANDSLLNTISNSNSKLPFVSNETQLTYAKTAGELVGRCSTLLTRLDTEVKNLGVDRDSLEDTIDTNIELQKVLLNKKP